MRSSDVNQLSVDAAAWRRTHGRREARAGPHLHGPGRSRRIQQAANLGVRRGLFGVLLQSLLQRMKRDTEGRGSKLHPGVGAACVHLRCPVVAVQRKAGVVSSLCLNALIWLVVT